MRIRTSYYQQFDADFSLEYPVEGYAGWKTTEIEIDPVHTALVVMHAWDLGSREEFPGQFRCCYEVASTYRVCREVFPPLLGAVRQSPLSLFHVVSGSGYYEQYPGWARTQALMTETPLALPRVDGDPIYDRLNRFRHDDVFPGEHNQADCSAAWKRVAFPKEAEPRGDEGIAVDQHQLFALCRDAGINHLIYTGFNIDWCLLMSPGGMVDMSRYGIICSAVRDGVTAVENRETIREGVGKAISLWRVSVGFGFVFDAGDIVAAVGAEA